MDKLDEKVQHLEDENKRLRYGLETLAKVEWKEWEEDDMSATAFRYVLLEQAGVPEESWECCGNVPGIGEFLRQVLVAIGEGWMLKSVLSRQSLCYGRRINHERPQTH